MSSFVRRKGKPNKGGGRGGGKGGGGGRGGKSHANKSQTSGSRKGSSKIWDDGDDFCVFGEPGVSSRSSSSTSKGGAHPKRRPETRVPLQTLHMTSENQEKVKALLRELQGQEPEAGFEGGASGEEEEADYCDDEQYWSASREASLVCNHDPMEPAGSVLVKPHIPGFEVSPFAVQKLSRYGFNTEYCEAALKSCDGDVGASLEHLLSQCFSERYAERMEIPAGASRVSREECMEQRQEEAFALRSICGEKFVERIQNRVWTIGLELEHLTSKLCKSKQTKSAPNVQTAREICQFYLQGNCRFGSKCKFRHENPSRHLSRKAERSIDDSHLRSNGDVSFLYELEIRFSEGSKYPFQAPLVAFYSTNENLPPACRLHISEFLYGKALTFAETAEPVVYSLLTLLEDDKDIAELLTNAHHKYSVPPVNLLPVPSVNRTDYTANRKPAVPHCSCVSSPVPEVKKEPELEEEEDEDEGLTPVMVENESYVNLKKKISRRYDWQAKSVYAENARICKQFQIKKVEYGKTVLSSL